METDTSTSVKKRKTREMHSYQFAIWLDGKGFFKDGMEFTFNSTEAKIYERAIEARKAVKAFADIGVNGFRLLEFK